MTAAAVAVAFVTVVVSAAGWLVLGFWLLRGVRRALIASERLALALLAGGGLTGIVLFVAGQALLSRPVVLLVTAASFLPALSPAERRELGATVRALRPPPAAVVAPLIGLFALLLLSSLARPAGTIGNDGISYHLFGPHVWLRQHRILPVLDASHTAFPAAIETLFAAVMSWGGERAPGVVGVVMTLALIVQAYGLARWLGASERFAQLSSLLLAFIPVVVAPGLSGLIDAEYAGFAISALRLLLTAETAASPVAGLFLGLAAATKYNGLTLAPLTLALACLCHARAFGAARVVRVAVVDGLLVALCAAPFLLRNLILLGTPIYPPPPSLARLLPAKAFSYEASVAFQHYIVSERGSGLGRGLADLLLLPWRFTFHTSNFHGAGGIGLGPLAFLPAALVSRPPATARWALVWVGVNSALWFLVQQEARFYVPFLVVLMAVTARGAEALVDAFPRVGRLAVAAVLAISVGYGGIIVVKQCRSAAASVVSRGADARRWNDEVPFASAFAYLNQLPATSRVLILNPLVPPYFLERDYVKIEGLYKEHPIAGVEDAGTALARARSLGVTHVLDVHPQPARAPDLVIPVPPPPPLELVFEAPDARVFRLR